MIAEAADGSEPDRRGPEVSAATRRCGRRRGARRPVHDRRLAGRDRPLRLTELHRNPPASVPPPRGRRRRGSGCAGSPRTGSRRAVPCDPRRPVGDESPACQQLLRPYDDAVVRRIDLEHVGRFAQGDAEPPPLPDREPERAVVLAEDLAAGSTTSPPGARCQGSRSARTRPRRRSARSTAPASRASTATGRAEPLGMRPRPALRHAGPRDEHRAASWPCPSMWSM